MSAFELLSTDGYALQAQFKLNGKEYGAMDDFSGFDPAHVDQQSPEFDILCLTDQSWEDMFSGNPDKKKELVKTGDWSYDGYGQITSVSPVVADFGDFTFEIGDITSDERCVGEFIHIVIDRLDLTFRSR
ncbi:hypothetical protein [Persicirhabdus sediminis]|uniref:Uncharacterized protein n=1 Tax=Persicirhabdus sediminis TaxID=454144 RepID=A0A8J7MBW7_9BACT|nr:hypothetical protein [Persicirhabdus sediminis]MBK1790622.1 hypothetical protein [Persicirhabdus sediminis]